MKSTGGLFECVKGALKLAHVLRTLCLNESLRLSHENCFVEVSIEESILHKKLSYK